MEERRGREEEEGGGRRGREEEEEEGGEREEEGGRRTQNELGQIFYGLKIIQHHFFKFLFALGQHRGRRIGRGEEEVGGGRKRK
jgi:hypothetical protein